VVLDDAVGTSFGRRATDVELKGVPVRLEVGPRDVKEGVVTLVRRDTGEKEAVPVSEAAGRVPGLLDDVQAGLKAEAAALLADQTTEVATVAEAVEAAATGFATIPWATLGEAGEAELASQGVTVRVLRRPDGGLPLRDDEPDLVATVARAY